MRDPAVDPLQVAIDGPAGSGKSTVAAHLARRLGLVHVDTGAMYRALTLVCLREGMDPGDGPALARALEGLDLAFVDGRLHLDGEDVAAAIRGTEVTAHVSRVSAHGEVRAAMVLLQRRLCCGAEGGAVLEGRDIGSVVLPLAPCKIYLDAGARERARRRLLQQGEAEDPVRLEEVRREIQRRDRMDSEREVSPLLIAPDAHVLDTTELSLDAVVERCAAWAEEARDETVEPAEFERLRGHDRFFAFVQAVVRILVFRPCGLRIHGRVHERIAGPLIYAPNHVSEFDPPLVGSTAARQVHFLAKSELFVGLFGRLIARLQAIPIVRGRWDPVAFQAAADVLAGQGSLLIFPEGTRRPAGRPGPPKRGLGALIQMAPAPFVPVFVRGTRRLGACLARRERLEMWIGRARRLHALPVLERTLSDAEIQQRVGRLWLACIEDLAARSREAAERP